MCSPVNRGTRCGEENIMATKTHVAVTYGSDSASDTTDDESSGDEAAPSSEDLLQTGRKDEIENVGDDIESASHSTEGSSGSEEDDTGAQLDDVDNDQMTDSGDGGDEEGDGEDEESKNEDSEKDESENDEEDDGEGAGQSGLANVMAKILKKKTPEKKSAILAKAKTDRELQWKKRQAELKAQEEEGDGKVKPEKTMNSFQREREKHIKRKQWEEMGHIKPHVLDREKERRLQRIATRGIVQLFNAVKKQQKSTEEKLKEAGSSELKRERVMKSVSKGEFLDMLKGSTSNVTAEPVDAPPVKKSKKQPSDNSSANAPTWSVLRDDFMMGGGMKDWDKEDEDEDESAEDEAPDMEDSSDAESS